MVLTDTARYGWSSLQGKPFLRWVTNPALPVLAAATLGALIGYAASLVGKLFRLDEENHAKSSIAWGLTCWRRPRIAVWIGAFTLIPLFTVYVLREAAGPLHWNLWMPLSILASLWVGLFALLVMRSRVVSDEQDRDGWFSNLALNRAATWFGLLLWAFLGIPVGAMFGVDWILTTPLNFVLAFVGTQLLVRRDENPLRWKELLHWRTLSAFFVLDFYLVLLLLCSVGPVIALSLVNIYLVPAIYQICAAQGVGVPEFIRFESKLSWYVANYWWTTLPWLLFPAKWLLEVRLVWQSASAGRKEGSS
jgi:hypothetical protein